MYTQAQAIAGDKSRWSEVENLLENIGSNNGKLRRYTRWLHALARAIQPGMAARQPALLARKQSRPLQRVGAVVDRARSDKWHRLVARIVVAERTRLPPAASEAGLPRVGN